ncbi:hypothetical protein IAG41_09790 [Sphingomonas sp. JC676]|uniref:hypothetical protein n=1 Tax=Sphingomonas sp. JC676 TaxID=2768065 RepID=UPI00165858D0|nr:hypothetical protein [Sphingomonas sp. JC676]MBC9032683.1 hypothetical protein [Sphingomonas sp. JC676]
MDARSNDRWGHPEFRANLGLSDKAREAPSAESREAKNAARVVRLISRKHIKLVEATPEQAVEIARRLSEKLYCSATSRPKVRFPHQDGDNHDPGYRMTKALRPLSCALYGGPVETHGADYSRLAALGQQLTAFHERHCVDGDVRFRPVAWLARFLVDFTARVTEAG